MTTLKIKRLHQNAVVPAYQTDGAACFDLVAVNSEKVGKLGGTAIFNTGLAFEIPAGHVMLIYSRSGHGFKNSLRLVNSVGVIDSDYRGEVAVKIVNDSPIDFSFAAGDRVAQAMILPLPSVDFIETDQLTDTDRGGGGFGSTGAN